MRLEVFSVGAEAMLINVIVYALTFVEILTALLLIGIILIQQSKSGGGLGAMGGGVTETVFGATAGNVLTRGTVILASIFLCVTLLLAMITGHRRVGRSIAEDLAPAAVSVEAAAEAPADDSAVPVESAAETAEDGVDAPAPESEVVPE